MTIPSLDWLDRLSGRECINVATNDIGNYRTDIWIEDGSMLDYAMNIVDGLNKYFVDSSIIFRCEQEKITNVEAVRIYIDMERSRPLAPAYSVFVDYVQSKQPIDKVIQRILVDYISLLCQKYPHLIWHYADEMAQAKNYILDFNEACKLFL